MSGKHFATNQSKGDKFKYSAMINQDGVNLDTTITSQTKTDQLEPALTGGLSK